MLYFFAEVFGAILEAAGELWVSRERSTWYDSHGTSTNPTPKLFRNVRPAVLPKCEVCGYDLRATPDRCPECGTVPTVRPALVLPSPRRPAAASADPIPVAELPEGEDCTIRVDPPRDLLRACRGPVRGR